MCDRMVLACRERRFTECVKRARADVAVDDTNAAESERPEAGDMGCFAGAVGDGLGNRAWRHERCLKLVQCKNPVGIAPSADR